ncbi:hypothetical protein BHE74_00028097 [Ensete ventricosum]|nr:hypothetical protein BHE74_00028097 [Ensete ventricosum]
MDLWKTGVRRGPHRKSNLTVDEQRTQEHKAQAVLRCLLLLGLSRLYHNLQMWRLNDSGTLVNSYSTLCATIVSEAAAYLADTIPLTSCRRDLPLFLQPQFSSNSNFCKDLLHWKGVLGGEFLGNATCKCTEVWSGHKFGQVNQISMAVAPHGCALFVLHCTDQFHFSKV